MHSGEHSSPRSHIYGEEEFQPCTITGTALVQTASSISFSIQPQPCKRKPWGHSYDKNLLSSKENKLAALEVFVALTLVVSKPSRNDEISPDLQNTAKVNPAVKSQITAKAAPSSREMLRGPSRIYSVRASLSVSTVFVHANTTFSFPVKW